MIPITTLPTSMNRSRSDSVGALASRKGSDGSSIPMTPAEAMAAYQRVPGKEPPQPMDMGQALKYSGGGPRGLPVATTGDQRQNPDTIYQTIQDNAAKRITSLDYLKKT